MKVGDVVCWKVDHKQLLEGKLKNKDLKMGAVGLVIDFKKENERDFVFVYWGPGKNGWCPKFSVEVL